MTYLDPLRLALSGDKARALQHVRTARAVAFGLINLNAEGGAIVGRREVQLSDGTNIEIVQAGLDVTAHIDSPEYVPGEEITIAFVAVNGTTPPKLLLVDVDREKIDKSITGLGSLISVVAHPKDRRFVFVVNTLSQIIKVDLADVTAIGATYADTPFTDMFVSEDGERLYARYRATGNPLSGGVYGGVLIIATSDLSLIAQQPNMLWAAATYRGAEHPGNSELLYLPVYGDGDLDGAPDSLHPGDSSYNAEAVEVYNRTGGAPLLGDTLHEYYIASSRGFRELTIDSAGERAYVCGSRSDTFVEGGGSLDLSTLVVYDVEAGTLTRLFDMFVGVQLTGCVCVSRDNSRVFVKNAGDADTRVLERTTLGYNERTPFPCRASSATENFDNRAIQNGPKLGKRPDNRVFFLSNASRTLWVFEPHASTPTKRITFVDAPNTFSLGRARRLVPKEPV
jgi:hypothetical protein